MQIKLLMAICLILAVWGIPVSGTSQQLSPDLFHSSAMVSSEIAQKQIQIVDTGKIDQEVMEELPLPPPPKITSRKK